MRTRFHAPSAGAEGRTANSRTVATIQTIKLAAASCLLWAIICSVSALTFSIRGPLIRTLAVDAGDLRTDQWFQAEGEKLYGELFGKSRPERIAFAHGSSQQRDGRRVETVTADCEDRSGRQLLSLLWNAHSHELISLVSASASDRGRTDRCLSSTEALTSARGWVQTIGMGDRLDRWAALRPPRVNGDRWDIRLVSGNRTAYVAIDARTRSLCSARLSSQNDERYCSGFPFSNMRLSSSSSSR